MTKVTKVYLVFLNGISNAGGAERMTYYLNDYFKQRAIQTVILEERKLQNTFIGKYYWKLFQLKRFEKKRMKYIARFATAYLWTTFDKHKIVISNGEPTAFYATDFVISHGCCHKMELDYGRKDQRLSRIAKLQKKACEKAKSIIAVAENVKKDLNKYYNIAEDKIRVIPNCIDIRYFYPLPKPVSNDITVAYIGRLEIGKGLNELRILAEIIEQKTNWKLIIASNNPNNTELFQHLKKTKVLIDLSIDEINEKAYSMADIVYYPTHSESFGMVTIEALSCGRPIAGTAVGVLPELVKENVVGVYILPAEVDDKLLDFFETCIENSKSVTPQDLHQIAIQKFSIESYFENLDAIFL
nr:glycosyltransferase family 4 protein [uncultured Flavobacterium sp.]